MKTKITPEVSEFIFKNYLKMSKKEIAQHFGFSESVCDTFYKKNNLILPRGIVIKFKTKHLYKPFSQLDNDYIINNIQTKSLKEIAIDLNKGYNKVREQAHKLGLSEIIALKKESNYFKKGRTSVNKGLKQSEYMTQEGIEKTKATRFKKGNEPKNTTFDGNITIRTDHKNRNGNLYKWLRISKGKWKQLHRHIWETERGEIPEDFNIVFKDGNTLNCVIENLECISNEENMKRNSIHRYPNELKSQIFKVAKIKKIIKNKENNQI